VTGSEVYCFSQRKVFLVMLFYILLSNSEYMFSVHLHSICCNVSGILLQASEWYLGTRHVLYCDPVLYIIDFEGYCVIVVSLNMHAMNLKNFRKSLNDKNKHGDLEFCSYLLKILITSWCNGLV
jgi:hypothetical protein